MRIAGAPSDHHNNGPSWISSGVSVTTMNKRSSADSSLKAANASIDQSRAKTRPKRSIMEISRATSVKISITYKLDGIEHEIKSHSGLEAQIENIYKQLGYSRADQPSLGLSEEEHFKRFVLLKYLIYMMNFVDDKQIASAAQIIAQARPYEIRDAFKRAAEVCGIEDIFSATSGEPPVSRFAAIPLYANREHGENAIDFYRRAWAKAPNPTYREDVEQHDPQLVLAIAQRCSNLNRGRPPAEKLFVGDVLPPRRPLEPVQEHERARARRKQLAYTTRVRGQRPT